MKACLVRHQASLKKVDLLEALIEASRFQPGLSILVDPAHQPARPVPDLESLDLPKHSSSSARITNVCCAAFFQHMHVYWAFAG